MQEYLLYQTSDPTGERDEMWTLVVPKNGEPFIEHDRLWRGPRLGRGKVYYALSEFLALGDAFAKARLEEVMNAAGMKIKAEG